MKLIKTGLAAAGLMALGACGDGSENKAANTVVEEVNVVEDNLLDESLTGNVAGNESGNAVEAEAAGNAAGNVQ